MKLSVFTFLALAIVQSNAARILAILPLPILSHHHFFRPILRELSSRGHDVTVITMIPDKEANYKEILVTDEILYKLKESINFFEMRKDNWISEFLGLAYLSERACRTTYENPEVQKLIHSTDLQFDLIIVESTFVQESFVTFGHKFSAPVIELQSLCTSFWSNELLRNPNSFSYIVDYKTHSSNQMNFMERLHNTITGISSLLFHRYILTIQEKHVEQYMNYTGWETRPSLIDQLSNTALVIANTHIALHYPQPNNPNIIYAAGVHIKPPKKLPEDLQSFLDDAKEGVIYFSMGSNVKSSMMPEYTKQAIISAFSKLPFKFLWKWETESLTNQPTNIKISKWFPQTDILNHPNLKAFITHGGILSITESVFRGVPMIVIPLFGDQPKNSIQAETAGFGIALNFDNITEEAIIWAVTEITKPKYKEAVLKQSSILRDNPMSALDSAIYWIEYVIRYKGASHLRTAAIQLAWYEYYLIDVIAVLISGVMLAFIILYLLLRAICKRLCGKKSEQKSVKSSKKKN